MAGCRPWGRTGSDKTEATLHACIGKGNGNPLQHSCLENARDGGAWRAAIYGVAQSQTRRKRICTHALRRQWQPTPAFLPGESQGQRSLARCRPRGRAGSDMPGAPERQQQPSSVGKARLPQKGASPARQTLSRDPLPVTPAALGSLVGGKGLSFSSLAACCVVPTFPISFVLPAGLVPGPWLCRAERSRKRWTFTIFSETPKLDSVFIFPFSSVYSFKFSAGNFTQEMHPFKVSSLVISHTVTTLCNQHRYS